MIAPACDTARYAINPPRARTLFLEHLDRALSEALELARRDQLEPIAAILMPLSIALDCSSTAEELEGVRRRVRQYAVQIDNLAVSLKGKGVGRE